VPHYESSSICCPADLALRPSTRILASDSRTLGPCEERATSDAAVFIDVLDRVLDKGIIIDGWGRVSVAGIDLIGIDGWVVVASIQTYLQYAESLGLSPKVPERQSMSEIPF